MDSSRHAQAFDGHDREPQRTDNRAPQRGERALRALRRRAVLERESLRQVKEFISGSVHARG